MKRLEAVMAALFGGVFVLLALAVALETALRKLFNVSLQGVDELGGYALAFGASLAFVLALVARAHIRIDLVHDRLPRSLRVAMNSLSVLANAIVAALLAYMAWYALKDSIALSSTAQTPWATPLRIPQSFWFGALVLFAVVAAGHALRVAWLLLGSRSPEIDRDYSPKGTKEELKEELEDIKARGATGAQGAP